MIGLSSATSHLQGASSHRTLSVATPAFQTGPLQFDSVSSQKHQFWYEGSGSNKYLDSFRRQYKIDTLIGKLNSDSAKALRILNWTHKQWLHNGTQEPSHNDAFTILQEAGQGKKFRCVEYSIVTATALNAIGLPSRVLSLKTKDAATRAGNAGHVVTEVYLRDLKKWVLIDGQWNMMPVLNGLPLNAVELQHAIAINQNALSFRSLTGRISKDFYIYWLGPYLYHFDVAFDNREGPLTKRKTSTGKRQLMLVPKGAAFPTVFQQHWPLTDFAYTHALPDFYAAPKL